jgi:YD repeat-containing protein
LTIGEETKGEKGVGSRTTSFAYDALERLDTVTDPLL